MKTNRFGNHSHLPQQSAFDLFLLGVIFAGGTVALFAFAAAAVSPYLDTLGEAVR